MPTRQHVFDLVILGAALLQGLAGSAGEPSKALAQDGTNRESRSGHDLRNTEPAEFEVPAMWEYGAPLIAPERRDHDSSRAQKDPTLVFHDGKWHVFMTVKLPGRSAIEYCSFEKWEDADRLDGQWTPVADTAENPFAGWKNIRPARGVEPWTDNVSHGELIRDGNNQTLTVDPGNLRLVFQGMFDKDKAGKGYGQFSWRIDMLRPVTSYSNRLAPRDEDVE